ncbi:G2/mitotic-specific cyclin-B2 [Blomia tropicalis]|nr:G2/mitotic-specific cyclin-B2 [Blomia tropicalis]
MFAFPSRQALRNVPSQSNINKEANQNIKNLKTLNIHDENKQLISSVRCSKIPVLSTRSRLQSNQQKENICIKNDLKTIEALFQTKSQRALAAKQATLKPKPIENIDNDSNCFLLSQYAPEIYKYLREVEEKQNLNVGFLSNKNCVTANMRAILINWLIQVHHSFELTSETLYISISILDRYMARESIQKSRLQLVGITTLFIAAKYEEIYYPAINEFVNVCDSLYNKRDIIRMELQILDVLKFELGRPIPLHFLRRGSKAAKADGRTHMMAKYICELSLCEYESAHWNPSLLAATALYLALRLTAIETGTFTSDSPDIIWTPTIEHYTGYSRSTVFKHAGILAKVIVGSEASKFQNCKRKYSSSTYMQISKSQALSSKWVKRLASGTLFLK